MVTPSSLTEDVVVVLLALRSGWQSMFTLLVAGADVVLPSVNVTLLVIGPQTAPASATVPGISIVTGADSRVFHGTTTPTHVMTFPPDGIQPAGSGNVGLKPGGNV